jgi:hypothetical protein
MTPGHSHGRECHPHMSGRYTEAHRDSSWPKAGVSASESRVPPAPFPHTCCAPGGSGNWSCVAGAYSGGVLCRLEDGWPPTGNWRICRDQEGKRQRVRVSSPRGHPPPSPAVWWYLHWLHGWSQGLGPACLGGPCQQARGAGDLGWFPHASQLP